STIPNSGFETWISMGNYNNPDSWSCLNDVTALANTYTCVKGTPGNEGAAYIKLTSKNVLGLGIMPGIALCGKLDIVNVDASTGFAYSEKPLSLTGKWQYMASGNDQGFIGVLLTKWDNNMMMRDTIAYAYYPLTGMAMSWASFTINLTYMSTDAPDSAVIVLSASEADGVAPASGSYLYVDGLNFTGTYTSVTENSFDAGISIFPNPANENLTIDLSVLNNKNVSLEVTNVLGKRVKEINNVFASSNTILDVADLPKGNYLLKVISGGETFKRTFVKQ
ncbi:MAG: T9SS type A sorting domain-containing protein, partial [Chitinophagales bacterium]|nr:T9SS type A sorting domain-containing protein [Chitinophagales bacterium]